VPGRDLLRIRIAELQDLFLKEAVKYSVLPLDDRTQCCGFSVEEVYEALAAAHSRAIARLSRGIPDALRSLDRSGE